MVSVGIGSRVYNAEKWLRLGMGFLFVSAVELV